MFEQNELESVTEKLSEMVARPYLRTPRAAIVAMTSKVNGFLYRITLSPMCRSKLVQVGPFATLGLWQLSDVRFAVVEQVRQKRHDFIRAVSKGLIPPETPPALRRVRRRRFPGLLGMDAVEDVNHPPVLVCAAIH